MSTANESLIDAFWQAQRQGVHFPPDWFGKLSLDQAYPSNSAWWGGAARQASGRLAGRLA